MTIPHEFQVWQNGAPVLNIGVDFDFDGWDFNYPYFNLVIDESWEPDRRRVQIF